MERNKPAPATRLLLAAALFAFLRISNNPFVTLEARLGLSPSPLERLFGIEGPFSGMTEASHRLAYFDLQGATSAHPLVLPFWLCALSMVLTWRYPVMNRPSDEVRLLVVALLATAVNNIA